MIDEPYADNAVEEGTSSPEPSLRGADPHVPTPRDAAQRRPATAHVPRPPRAGATNALRPLAGPLLMGVGLGGLVDGVLMHQVLQWHHLGSSAAPGEPVATHLLADGVFHAVMIALLLVGLTLWWHSHAAAVGGRRLVGLLLLGAGLFNVLDGVVSHLLLGVHHVNETAPRSQWWAWDGALLALALAMVAAGWLLVRASGVRPIGAVSSRTRARL